MYVTCTGEGLGTGTRLHACTMTRLAHTFIALCITILIGEMTAASVKKTYARDLVRPLGTWYIPGVGYMYMHCTIH